VADPRSPGADIVTYRIAGEQVARFDADFADRRETWNGCPGETPTYEGRDCPVSPLRTIAQAGREGGKVVHRTEPPRVVGCNRYRAHLDEAMTTTWIRPDRRDRDCFSDFVVALSVDGAGRVVAVDSNPRSSSRAGRRQAFLRASSSAARTSRAASGRAL
jgi:hypothetical protein